MEPELLEHLMAIALDEARAALAHDDVPIGAVVARLDDGEVLARRHNERELTGDPTAHAEVLALRDAAAATRAAGGSTSARSSSRSSRARCAPARS